MQLVLPRPPHRPDNPQAVGEGDKVADEADKLGAGVYAHDDLLKRVKSLNRI